jgi:NAD(P)-dependent dehydrogenase (short-subunit alcohol dehydrogenase family)
MSNQRTAVVTGAATGFGRLTALAFAADGWRVYATLRDIATRNAQAAAELRSSGVSVVELDVTDDASVDAAAKLIHADGNAVDVLVNNAGSGYFGIQEAFTPAAAERQFATNVIGPLRVNRAFLPAMRERGSGLIVYVSSIVGRLALPYAGIYVQSKWALEAQAEIASYELAPFGIDVAIVQPGAYPTEIFGKVVGADDSARVAAYGAAGKHVETLNAGMAAASAGKDPRDVAVAFLELANAPAGTRPLRTTVPANPAADAINASTAPVQHQVMEAFGLGDLLRKVPTSV